MGSLIFFGGFQCQRVDFRRSRGFTSDTSHVDLTVDMGSFSFQRGTVPSPNPDPFALLSGKPVALDQPEVLSDVGELLLAESVPGDGPWVVRVPGLYVARCETKKLRGSMAVLTLFLMDARFFWGQGVLRRWSFNRIMGDGSIAKDSGASGGGGMTLKAIAEEVVASFRGAPSLERVPSGWEVLVASVEAPRPLCPPKPVLEDLVARYGTEEPCLRLDGSVALHEAGDGLVGWAQGSTGGAAKGPNLVRFDDRYKLDKGGAGQGEVVEPQYPEEFLVIVGGVRVASVALDDWEPVLVVRGTPLPLNDETLGKLTNGRYNLAWLARWILAPPALQNDVALPPAAIELLRTQAWRYWRLPGAVTKDGKPGPNAHLLPLLERAETVGGRRLPVTVETYNFASVHRSLASSQAEIDLAGVTKDLAQIRAQLQAAAKATGAVDPWNGATSGISIKAALNEIMAGGQASTATGEQLGKAFTGTFDEKLLQSMIDQASIVARARAVDGTLGASLDASLKKKFGLQDSATGKASARYYEIAKQVVEFTDKVNARTPPAPFGSRLGTPPSNAIDWLRDPRFAGDRANLAQLFRELAEAERAADQAAEDRRRAGAQGATPAAKPLQAISYQNRTRRDDPDAKVLDSKAGIVVVSELPGWLYEPGVPTEFTGGPFLPGPVRVTFGAQLRPRVDLPPPSSISGGAVATGGGDSTNGLGKSDLERILAGGPVQGATPSDQARFAAEQAAAFTAAFGGAVVPSVGVKPTGGQSKAPAVLADAESVFRACYQRVSRGNARRVDFSAVPLRRAVSVDRRDLVELVPLDGPSNLPALLQACDAMAAQLARRPDVIESTKHVLARPWPVQCDGVVASVEIRSREGGAGFETVVTTGSNAFPTGLGGTRGRGPVRGLERSLDNLRREGLA